MKNIYKLIISIALPLLVGGISSIFTAASVKTWFVTIQKPSFNPPSWVFAPVWTTLYIMMGIAFYLVWKANASIQQKRPAYFFYAIQLTLNFLWSFLFFYSKRPDFALIDIVLLLVSIICTIKYFNPINNTAAKLLIPYLLWVIFATALNEEIWRLNS